MNLKVNYNLPAVPESFALLLIFIASLCCINSYDGSFAFDDSPAIINNPDVTSRPLSKLFENDFWGNKLTHKQSHRSYRPLTILTFRFHHWIRGQLNPVDFHVINLVLHTLACLLTYFVYKKLLSKDAQYLAFYSTILFAVHPVHCEAVSGIVGRADILCTIFVWLSILLYDRCIYLQNKYTSAGNLIGCTLCITAAMLCKETGITAIGLCFCYEFIIIHKKNIYNLSQIFKHQSCWEIYVNIIKTRGFIRLFILSIAGIILLAIRFSLMGFSAPTFQSIDNPASFISNFFLRCINYQYIYLLNMWLLMCPQWLSFDWSMGCVPLINDWDIRIIPIILFWLVLIMMIVQSLILKTKSSEMRHLAIGLCLMIIPFLPASNIFFTVGFVLAERTLYLPSAGYCFIISVGLRKLSHRFSTSRIILMMYILLIIFWFSRSWMRSEQWRNEILLFHSALSVCPRNAKVHYNVAKIASDLGNITMAEFEYRKALRLNPDYAQAMNNLGNLLKDQEQYQEAKKLLTRAVELQTDFAAAWMNLGIVLAALKEYDKSEECYRTSLFHRKNCPDCYYNLGLLFMERKEYSKALDAWDQAIQRDTMHRRAWTNTIRLLDDLGMAEKALDKGKIAMGLFQNDPRIHLNVANILGKLERFSEAEVEFQHAAALDNTNPTIYTNLGNTEFKISYQ
ncbi:hypothetical protein PV326_004130 [Microctonus aethiopoides]|nr:hypothetical protein PV326_004130 [Microctonus aethiopoides]